MGTTIAQHKCSLSITVPPCSLTASPFLHVRVNLLGSKFSEEMLSLLHLVAALGVSLAATRFAIRIDNAQETVNVDTLVTLGSHVSFTCTDDGNSITGNILLVSDIATTLANASEGVWIINSMSVEDQGAYRCCVQSQCKDLAVISELSALTRMHAILQ